MKRNESESHSVDPRVSVVVPTFNRGAELRRALSSLERQSYRSFEVIVVDDGSTDNTSEVVREFQCRLNLRYFFQENSGLPAIARNVGIRQSSSELLAFLDSDDWWTPDKLIASVKAIDLGADLVFHDLIVAKPEARFHVKRRIRSRSLSSDPLTQLLARGNVIPNSSVVVKRSCLAAVGGFDESVKTRAWEDYELWTRIAASGARFRRIRGQFGYYQLSETSLSRTVSSLGSLAEIREKFFASTARLPLWFHLGLGIGQVANGNIRLAHKHLIHAAFFPGRSRMRFDRLRALVWMMRTLKC